MSLDAYDVGNGSVQLSWLPFSASPDSYNVYVNGVLNQNVVPRRALVAGLTQTSYSAGAVVASSGNSIRPQNMPPTGQVTGPFTYRFRVVAVKTGVEGASTETAVTISPTSIPLATPMKRLFPFGQIWVD